MTAQQVSRYIELVNRRTQILNHSGVDWKPEYGLELNQIVTFLTGSICITIVAMIAITWLEDKTRTIKRALTSANVKGLRN